MYGPLAEGSAELNAIEISSVEAYVDAITTGRWVADESSLIQVGEPQAEGMGLCSSTVSDDITLAR